MEKVKFYMMVGLPGSGKSTVAEDLGVKIFSSDSLRKEMFGDENTQDKNDVLFQELHRRIKACLKGGESCVYDATNIRAKRRKQFLEEINNIACEKICIICATDIALCLEDNKNRERVVPDDIIKRMLINIDIPQYREGWDEIKIIRKTDYPGDVVDFVDALMDYDQHNPHHTKTLGEHLDSSVEYLINNYSDLDSDRCDILKIAAYCHDIGKPFCLTFDEDGTAHYYGHAKVSAYLALVLLADDIADKELLLYIIDLISLHMRMYDKNQRALHRLKDRIGEKEYSDLEILNEADMAAK